MQHPAPVEINFSENISNKQVNSICPLVVTKPIHMYVRNLRVNHITSVSLHGVEVKGSSTRATKRIQYSVQHASRCLAPLSSVPSTCPAPNQLSTNSTFGVLDESEMRFDIYLTDIEGEKAGYEVWLAVASDGKMVSSLHFKWETGSPSEQGRGATLTLKRRREDHILKLFGSQWSLERAETNRPRDRSPSHDQDPWRTMISFKNQACPHLYFVQTSGCRTRQLEQELPRKIPKYEADQMREATKLSDEVEECNRVSGSELSLDIDWILETQTPNLDFDDLLAEPVGTYPSELPVTTTADCWGSSRPSFILSSQDKDWLFRLINKD